MDQRAADAFSLVFDSPPLAEDVEILGFPWWSYMAARTRSRSTGSAWRFGDVAPDGTVTLVTGGGRAGRPDPRATAVRSGGVVHSPPGAGRAAAGAARHLVGVPARPPDPARAVQREVADDLADAAPGHGHGAARAGTRAGAARGARGPGGRRAGAGVRRARPGGAPPGDPALGRHGPGAVDPAAGRHRGRRDLGRGSAGTEFPWGRVVDEEYLRYSVHDERPADASMRGEARTEFHLDGRAADRHPVLDIGSDETSLHYSYRRELRRDGMVIRERSWQRRYPRDGH